MATITQPLTGVPIIQHRGHAEIERDEECGYVDKKDGYGEGEIGRGMITSMSMNSDEYSEMVLRRKSDVWFLARRSQREITIT